MNKRICGHCLAENEGNNKYCIFCGAPLDEPKPDKSRFQQERLSDFSDDLSSVEYGQETYRKRGPNEAEEEIIYTSVAPRSIALCIILTIFTLGIYGLYWMYRLNNDVNELAQDPIAPGGGMVIFLCFVTLGIYSLFWYYKMGQKCDYIRQIDANSGLLYLILAIFGLGIVSNAFIQDSINKVLE